MIRVYRSPDAHEAPPPLELVRAFRDEEREAAWALLHELGGESRRS